jgi:hypothetical protein
MKAKSIFNMSEISGGFVEKVSEEIPCTHETSPDEKPHLSAELSNFSPQILDQSHLPSTRR